MNARSQLEIRALGKIAYELKIATQLPADKSRDPGWHLGRAAFNSAGTDIWQPAVWVTRAVRLGRSLWHRADSPSGVGGGRGVAEMKPLSRASCEVPGRSPQGSDRSLICIQILITCHLHRSAPKPHLPTPTMALCHLILVPSKHTGTVDLSFHVSPTTEAPGEGGPASPK